MDIDLFKKAVEAAPILVISLGAVLVVIHWALKFIREARTDDGNKIVALTASVNKNTETMAELGGRMVEALNNSTDAIREIASK